MLIMILSLFKDRCYDYDYVGIVLNIYIMRHAVAVTVNFDRYCFYTYYIILASSLYY